MKRGLVALLTALALAAVIVPGRAVAQLPSTFTQPFARPYQNPLGTPVFSPYLNLTQGGNAAVNYFGLVRPQVQTQQQLQQLQQQQLAEQAAITGLTTPGGFPLITGHETRFMNYGTFFPPTVGGFGQRR